MCIWRHLLHLPLEPWKTTFPLLQWKSSMSTRLCSGSLWTPCSESRTSTEKPVGGSVRNRSTAVTVITESLVTVMLALFPSAAASAVVYEEGLKPAASYASRHRQARDVYITRLPVSFRQNKSLLRKWFMWLCLSQFSSKSTCWFCLLYVTVNVIYLIV